MSSSAEPFEFGTLEPLATLAGGGGDRTLEEMLDELRATAHAEGFEAGRQEALAAIRPAMQSLADALQGAGENADRFLEDAERSAVELALALARKMVGAAFEVQPELVLEAVDRRAAADDRPRPPRAGGQPGGLRAGARRRRRRSPRRSAASAGWTSSPSAGSPAAAASCAPRRARSTRRSRSSWRAPDEIAADLLRVRADG